MSRCRERFARNIDVEALVERGVSGRVHDEKAQAEEAQVVITRTKPLEVRVRFDLYQLEILAHADPRRRRVLAAGAMAAFRRRA